MPYRKIDFKVGNIFHIFNRTVNKETIFSLNKNKQEINRFFALIDFYRLNFKISYSDYILIDENRKKEIKNSAGKCQIIEIYVFSLMPNHFHFIIKQLQPKGISNFMSKIQNSLAKYYNIKHKRHGSLFCEMFKAVRIKSNEDLNIVSRYIHLNPVTANLIKKNELSTYPLTSFPYYLDKSICKFINKKPILDNFKNIRSYKKYILEDDF